MRLPDVLLHPEVRVFEPLWTAVTSSKALLPVLSRMYPNRPGHHTYWASRLCNFPSNGEPAQDIKVVGITIPSADVLIWMPFLCWTVLVVIWHSCCPLANMPEGKYRERGTPYSHV